VGYGVFDAVEAIPTAMALPDGQGGTRYTAGLTGRF
jgi:hypothetical protein